MSNKAEKTPSDNNKPSVIKSFSQKEEKKKNEIYSEKPLGQNIFPTLNNDSKKEESTGNINEKIEDVEPSEIVVPEEETDNKGFIEKTETKNGFKNLTNNIKSEFLSKMSKKNSSDHKVTEAETESKPNKLIKTFSNTFAKGKTTMKGEEVKAKVIPISTAKLKRFLPSSLDKQTTKKENENKKGDKSDKIKSTLFSKLKNMKKHKATHQDTNTIEQEMEVQHNVKDLCSKLTTKTEEKIEQNKKTPIVKNCSDKLENFKKKCSISFKKENGDENNEIEKVEEKEKTDVSGIKLRLPSIGKSKKEDAKKNMNDQASESPNKMDQLKNRVCSLMKRKEDAQEKCETQLENQTQSGQSIKLRKEVTMNKLDMSKFQWIMLDGQWTKSQSVGL